MVTRWKHGSRPLWRRWEGVRETWRPIILILIHYILIGITTRNIKYKSTVCPSHTCLCLWAERFCWCCSFCCGRKKKKRTHFEIALASDTGEAYLHTDYVLLHVCVCLRVCNAVFFLCMFIQIKKGNKSFETMYILRLSLDIGENRQQVNANQSTVVRRWN